MSAIDSELPDEANRVALTNCRFTPFRKWTNRRLAFVLALGTRTVKNCPAPARTFFRSIYALSEAITPHLRQRTAKEIKPLATSSLG